MTETLHALVLHTVRYGESSLIVDVFTRERGAMSVVVRGSRGKGGRGGLQLVRGALAQVLLVVDYRQSKPLQTAREVQTLVPYLSIPFEPRKQAMTLFLSEFLYYALRREATNEPLFDYLSTALRWLDEAGDLFVNFHLALLIHLTRFLGLWPSSDDYHEGDLFDLVESRFCTVAPVHGSYLTSEEAHMLDKYLRMDYRNMGHFRFSRALRRRVLDLLTLYYRIHVAEFREVKSLEVLRECFD